MKEEIIHGCTKEETNTDEKRSEKSSFQSHCTDLIECPHCHELIPSHTVCPNCGWYVEKKKSRLRRKRKAN